MTLTTQRLGTFLVAALMCIMLFHYWRIAGSVLHFSHSSGQLIVLALLYFALNIIAIVGMFQLSHWRTWVAIAAIAYSTIMFSTAYLFFINQFFAKPYRPVLTIMGNLFVILLVVLFRSYHSRRRG